MADFFPEASQEVKHIEQAVVGEVKSVEEAVVGEVKKLRYEISSEEKVLVRDLENQFLRAQLELQRINKIIEDAQKRYPQLLESLAKKYAVDMKEFVFNAVECVFTKQQ